MSRVLRRRACAAAAALVAVLVPGAAAAQAPVVRIGIVLDGPWERNAELLETFETEIRRLIRSEFDLQFPADKRLEGDFTLPGVSALADRLLTDPDVDVVLSLGPIASAHIGRLGALDKPVVAAWVLNPELEGIPVETDAADRRVSGVRNLSYVTFPANLPEEMRRFREVVPFGRLTLLANEGLTRAIPELSTNLQAIVESGIALDVVTVGNDLDAAIAAIPDDTEAVYVVPLIQLPPGAFDRLVAGLIERRLPSFSYWGRSDVDRGLMTSLYLDTDFVRLGRRLAINLQRILAGEDGGTLPVDFPRVTRLTLNVATARAVGVYPSWSVFTEAELLHDERVEEGQPIFDLATVARAAVAANLDLAAAQLSVRAGGYDLESARATLRPQLSVGGSGQLIDKDRAAAGFGGQPQRIVAGSASVTQLLYSEPARANLDIQADLQRGRERTRDELRLDVIYDATVSYLNVLRALTFERIQRENLSVTRSNLELAQARQRLGVARASEVVRWENQIANNRRSVIEANAGRNQAEIALNRVLNRPLEALFEVSGVELDDPALTTGAPQLRPYLDNPFAFDLFRDFMAAEALAASPELQQLDALIAVQERRLLSAERAFWSPTVALRGDLTTYATGGAGAEPPSGLSFFELPNRLNWSISFSASLPILTGGSRRAARAQAIDELGELRLARRAAAERIELALRSRLHRAGASFAAIELADAAADAARRNLEYVTDAYTQGAVAILDLLDAQNAALVADQVAASAVFDYLIDLMGVQRAVGRFDVFMTPDERQQFLDRLERFFRESGADGRTP